MAAQVYRYEVPVDDRRYTISLNNDPHGVGARRHDRVEFWAVHDDAKPLAVRTFVVVGTGHELPDDTVKVWGHALTAVGLVWHLVEVKS